MFTGTCTCVLLCLYEHFSLNMSVFTIYVHFIKSTFHELMAQVIFMLNLTLSDADSVDTEKIQKYELYKNIIQDCFTALCAITKTGVCYSFVCNLGECEI